KPALLWVEESDDEVAEGALRVFDEVAGGRAVGRDEHALVKAGAERIDGEDGCAFVASGLVDRLADDRAGAAHAGMAGGGRNGAVDTRVDHFGSVDLEVVDHHAAARAGERAR